MSSPEYQDILSSLQEITHRAYMLGRSEALKRVIAAMQADDPPPVPLQLMAPAEFTPPPPEAEAEPEHAEPSVVSPSIHPVAPAAPASDGPGPWWAKPPRKTTPPARTTH